jgi:choice-of-anchor B domain-containing protein
MQSLKIKLSILTFLVATNITFGLDSLNMTLLARWDVDTLPAQSNIQYNDIWGYTDCSGKEYAIMGSARYIHFIDISTPTAPREVAAHEAGQNSIWRDIKTYKDRAYAVADQGNDGLMIFDLSRLPDTATLSHQTTEYFNRTHNIFIDEAQGRLYVIGSNTQGNGVIILDLNDNPDEPTLLASIPLPGGYIHDMYVKDNIGFAASGGNGLWVYDFTDPLNPVVLGSLIDYIGSGYNHSNWATSDLNYLVFADETHGRSLKVADISDYTDISVVSQFKSELLAPEHTSSIAHNPFIRGQYIIVSYYHDGVQIFDLSNPDSVTNVAYYDTNDNHTSYSGYNGTWGVYPFFPSGIIVASDIENGLYVLSADSLNFESISAPTTPDVTLNEMGDSSICEGNSIVLEVSDDAENIKWYKDNAIVAENTLSYEANETGEYWVEMSNAQCANISERFNLTVNALPEVEVPYTEVTFCDENPMLEAPEGFDLYIWYQDSNIVAESTSPMLEISQSGEYQLEVAQNGCNTLTGAFTVNVGTIPAIEFNLSEQATVCDPVILTATNRDLVYQLFRNNELISEFDSTYTITESGDYVLRMENEFCEVESSEFSATINEATVPNVFLEENLLSASESASYQWYFNGNPIDDAIAQNYIVLEEGFYLVEVVDFQGCIAQSEEIFVSVTSTQDVLLQGVKIFPNPATELIHIDLTTIQIQIDAIELRNNKGQLIYQIDEPAQNIEMNLKHLAQGLYYVHFLQEGATIGARKLVKL